MSLEITGYIWKTRKQITVDIVKCVGSGGESAIVVVRMKITKIILASRYGNVKFFSSKK